jgi:predicted kinase
MSPVAASSFAGAAPAAQATAKASGAAIPATAKEEQQAYLRALGETIGNALIPVLIFAAPLALLAKRKRRKPVPVVVVGVKRTKEVEYEEEEEKEEEYGESGAETAENLIAQLLDLAQIWLH